MARTATSLSQIVLRFYLTAPLVEIDNLQPALREIYNNRNKQRAAIVAGREAAAGKGKGKGKGKKGKKADSDTGAAFGGKEVVAGEGQNAQL